MIEPTYLQQYAAARRLVGPSLLRLGSDETPAGSVIAEDRVIVVLSVARRVYVRGGSKVTHRGTRGLVFTFDPVRNVWNLSETFDTTSKLPEPEWEVSFGGVSPEEYIDKRAHEAMCHRPGNDRHPLDNADRLAQGIR